MSRVEDANYHPHVIDKRKVTGLLFVDYLAAEATAWIGVQHTVNRVKDFAKSGIIEIK